MSNDGSGASSAEGWPGSKDFFAQHRRAMMYFNSNRGWRGSDGWNQVLSAASARSAVQTLAIWRHSGAEVKENPMVFEGYISRLIVAAHTVSCHHSHPPLSRHVE